MPNLMVSSNDLPPGALSLRITYTDCTLVSFHLLLPYSRKYSRNLNLVVSTKIKLKWFWHVSICQLKSWTYLSFITYVTPPINECHFHDGTVHCCKLFEDTTCPNYLRLQQLERLVLQMGAQDHPDPYAMAVTSDSFTIVGHVIRRATYFQVVEHGYLTDHANGITKLTTPTIYTASFNLVVCFQNCQPTKFNSLPIFPAIR